MLKAKHIHINETDSTNQWLRSYMPESEDEMTVVTADYQTAGRGQGTNTWESQAGMNLLFSVLIRPHVLPAKEQFILSMANALALQEVLSNLTDGISIKWPNDIYWNNRKLCGTLIETTLRCGYVERCIIGTGVNVNQREFLSDAPNPVSLWQILGHDTERETLLQEMINQMAIYINKVETGQWASIRQQYHNHLYRLDEIHPYLLPDGQWRDCRLLGVENDGRLVLCPLDAAEKPLRFGFKEIKWNI